MRNDFIEAGKTQFGSGWCWLAIKDGKLAGHQDAERREPAHARRRADPRLDVWEHSYYIDYRNARPKYLEALFDNLINWDHVEQMLA